MMMMWCQKWDSLNVLLNERGRKTDTSWLQWLSEETEGEKGKKPKRKTCSLFPLSRLRWHLAPLVTTIKAWAISRWFFASPNQGKEGSRNGGSLRPGILNSLSRRSRRWQIFFSVRNSFSQWLFLLAFVSIVPSSSLCHCHSLPSSLFHPWLLGSSLTSVYQRHNVECWGKWNVFVCNGRRT